jgi:2-(1,2-epoxy-1,2-dihydrophenyl)acetyl-CoA isomerase
MEPEEARAEILCEINQGVATITLHRPETLNAFTPTMTLALNETLAVMEQSDDVRCVIVTGAGRGFSAGGDLKAMKARVATPQTTALGPRIDSLRRSAQIFRRLHDMAKPTIAMINGPCAGMAMSLVGACDLRFAGTSAVLTAAYMNLGLAGDCGGSWYWTQILGTAKARRLLLMCEKFGADAARDFGLVHEVWPDDELRGRTMAIAAAMAERTPSAMRYAKEALAAAESGTIDHQLSLEAMIHALSGFDRPKRES